MASEPEEPVDGALTSLYYGIRQAYIPTSPTLLRQAQKDIFNRFVRRQVEQKRFHLKSGEYLNYVDIRGDGQLAANTDTEGESGTEAPTLLLTHGFASGCGFFFSNYDSFGSQFKRVVAVDWLGMGGSSRPSDAPRMPWFGAPTSTAEAADFFTDSLEELRQELGLRNFVLAGHSLGGYLVGRYAMKHSSPDLKGLILISPAGLAPHPPPERIVPRHSLGFRLRLMGRAWDNNYTPQAIARWMGRLAPKYVRSAVNRRFGESRWAEEDMQAISNYLYHISALPASGEYAMNTLLTAQFVSTPEDPEVKRPRVLAREPISPEQLAHLRDLTGSAAERPIDLSVDSTSRAGGTPMLILYGDNDWLWFPEVNSYVQILRNGGVDVRLSTVREAGHHLYLDNPDQYHDEVHCWVRDKVMTNVKKDGRLAGYSADRSSDINCDAIRSACDVST